VKAIAVSGSTVYVAGYKGTAGSGTEVVFAVAYKASSKGLTILWEQESPAIPNAGKYRIGIKALGSKAVMFYNTDSGTESSVRGKVLGLDPKTGAIKWGPYDYGDPDHANKVNAIAIKGSQFAAVGFKESGGNKFLTTLYFLP
jgi:outer membrane protein assembly factor BamB